MMPGIRYPLGLVQVEHDAMKRGRHDVRTNFVEYRYLELDVECTDLMLLDDCWNGDLAGWLGATDKVTILTAKGSLTRSSRSTNADCSF